MLKTRLLEMLESERISHRLEREAWSKERSELLQRIQAPEVAVAQAASLDRENLPEVPWDDDETFNQVMAERNGDT